MTEWICCSCAKFKLKLSWCRNLNKYFPYLHTSLTQSCIQILDDEIEHFVNNSFSLKNQELFPVKSQHALDTNINVLCLESKSGMTNQFSENCKLATMTICRSSQSLLQLRLALQSQLLLQLYSFLLPLLSSLYLSHIYTMS